MNKLLITYITFVKCLINKNYNIAEKLKQHMMMHQQYPYERLLTSNFMTNTKIEYANPLIAKFKFEYFSYIIKIFITICI